MTEAMTPTATPVPPPPAASKKRRHILAMIALGIYVQYVPRNVFDRVGVSVSRLGPIALGASLAGGLFLITTLGPQGVAPFIYYRF